MAMTKYGKNGRSVQSIIEELEAKIALLEQNRNDAIKLAESWTSVPYAASVGQVLSKQFKDILNRTGG